MEGHPRRDIFLKFHRAVFPDSKVFRFLRHGESYIIKKEEKETSQMQKIQLLISIS